MINDRPVTKMLFNACMEHAVHHNKLMARLLVENDKYAEYSARDLFGNCIPLLRIPVVGPIPTVRRVVVTLMGALRAFGNLAFWELFS
jgi:hypothetical protein